MADECAVPVIDLACLGPLDDVGIDDNDEGVGDVARQVFQALSTIGFMSLKNTGISDDQVADIRRIASTFFNLPEETKRRYKRSGDTNNGWVTLEMETLNPQRPGDLKEAYNVHPGACALLWPDEECPEFRVKILPFFTRCQQLNTRVLQLIAIGLGLKDKTFFSRVHDVSGTVSNPTTLRLLHYPPLPENIEIKPNQIRCGEHSDYGSITLLFQDQVGGLEVMSTSGDYQAATPVPGTVLVNIGDLMQRWTSDKLVSTKHRVLIPEEDIKKRQTRQSIAFFSHPDDQCMITCIDGSNKYEPITSLDYLNMRFSETY